MMIISSWQWSQVATTEYLQNTPFGNAMDGAVQRTEFTCPSLDNYETGWPSIWMGDNGVTVDESSPGVYRRESGLWSQGNSTLTSAPWQFRREAGEFRFTLVHDRCQSL